MKKLLDLVPQSDTLPHAYTSKEAGFSHFGVAVCGVQQPGNCEKEKKGQVR